jgi:hypothetical protein
VPNHEEKQSSTFMVGSRGSSFSTSSPTFNIPANRQVSFQRRVQQQLFNEYS